MSGKPPVLHRNAQCRQAALPCLDQPINVSKLATLRLAIEEANAESGLNTCWAGLTYKKVSGAFTLRDEDIIHCEISLGYGENQGVQHPLKPAEKFFEAEGEVPEWFKAGLEAALLAPTAVNQQKFKFILRDGNIVETKTFASLWGYTQIDLGIVKYHFEVAAGKENFLWL